MNDDLISRQETLEELYENEREDEDIPNRADGVRDAIITVLSIPAVDAVPVVRCRDCKYWREHKYAKETRRYIPFCGFNAIYTKEDDFCSRGERREEDAVD